MKALAWLLAACTLAIVGRAHADEATSRPCLEVADVEQVYPRVDLNRADEAALEGLPGIGEAKARAIVAYRTAHGGFRNLSQLLNVKGIGRALLKRLRPHVTI